MSEGEAFWWDERQLVDAASEVFSRPSILPESTTAALLAHVDLDCPYLRECVLRSLSRRPAWAVCASVGEGELCSCPADALFTWAEYERVDWERVLTHGSLHTAAFCIRKGLIRKSQLCFSVAHWVSKHPTAPLAHGFPETHLFEFWDLEYLEEALAEVFEVRDMCSDGSEWWILKPSMTNQARGILVFNELDQLKSALAEEGAEDVREWVIQRYIHRPLLVNGRKFHLRTYALAVGAMAVYIWPDVLALFSLHAYAPNDPSAREAHITNSCLQAPRNAEEERACVSLLSALPGMLADERCLSLAEATLCCDRVLQDVAALVGDAFAAVSTELSFQALNNAFELFGFDLLVDENWKESACSLAAWLSLTLLCRCGCWRRTRSLILCRQEVRCARLCRM
jgi:hypothetical protein